MNNENPTPTENLSHPDTLIISTQTRFDGYRLRNFYITNAFQGFVWMIFHFSVVFFFTFLLQNVLLVGLFLGFANLVAFFIDIPLGILQKYIPTKRFFVIGAVSQLLAVSIFFAFIFKIFSLIHFVGNAITLDMVKPGMDWFFGNIMNWIGVLIAAICYGLTKEINDVSTYGYVLSHADPSEYGTILSRNNITFGIGSVLGLVFSGIILSFAPSVAVMILGILVIAFLVFTLRFFDNSLDSVSLDDIQSFRVSKETWNKEHVREYMVATIKKADIAQVIQGAKYLMLKPKQKMERIDIPWAEVYDLSKKEFGIIWDIFSHNPLYIGLIWTITLVLTFGFWDTFASSFLLDFLDTVKPGWSYILLAMIAVPGIVLQEYAIKLSTKIGVKTVGVMGLALSAGSLICMGIASMGQINPATIIILALINSLGYACGMSTGQTQFLDNYNRIYADHQNLTEINANASSGPMKVIQNFANVIGLVFGGILVSFGFSVFFLTFGFVVTAILIWTISQKDKIQL